MSKSGKKKASPTTVQAVSPVPPKTVKKKAAADNDMSNMMAIMQAMMLQNNRREEPIHEVHATHNSANSLNELREDVNMLSSSLSGRITQVEVKVSAINDNIEELKRMMKERNAKIDLDLQQCIKHTDDTMEEERTKRLKLLKALQKKLSDDDVALMDRIVKLKEEVTKITAGLSTDIHDNFAELSKVKGSIDVISHSRSQVNEDTTANVNKLQNKLKGLEAKVIANNNGMFIDSSGMDDDERFADDAEDEFMYEMDVPRSRFRSQSGANMHSNTYPRMQPQKIPVQRVLADLRLQLNRYSTSLDTTTRIANDAYHASTGKNHKLGSSASGSRDVSSSGHKNRRDDSDSDDNDNSKLSLKSQQSELKALGKRTKMLGENTSKACRSLSTGLSDVQQATLFLYAWCDKAHDAFGVVSSQLGLTTNMCPRVQVHRSSAPHRPIEEF